MVNLSPADAHKSISIRDAIYVEREERVNRQILCKDDSTVTSNRLATIIQMLPVCLHNDTAEHRTSEDCIVVSWLNIQPHLALMAVICQASTSWKNIEIHYSQARNAVRFGLLCAKVRAKPSSFGAVV